MEVGGRNCCWRHFKHFFYNIFFLLSMIDQSSTNIFSHDLFLVFADISHYANICRVFAGCCRPWWITESNQSSAQSSITFVECRDETIFWRYFEQTCRSIRHAIFLPDTQANFERSRNNYNIWAGIDAIRSKLNCFIINLNHSFCLLLCLNI